MPYQSLEQVELIKNTDRLVEYYEQCFKRLYGTIPDVDEDGRTSARWAVQKYGLEHAKTLLSCYLNLDNAWLKSQGFPLSLLRKNINAALVQSAAQAESILWVVALSESGLPVVSKNRLEMGSDYWFKPVPYDEYLKKHPGLI